MIISLYTVRLVLDTLGVIDYGVFNVVAGVVVMFSFLSNTMASASQRFFAFEIGRNDLPQLGKTFNMTFNIYVIIAIVILILAETIGLWFLNHKLIIPHERLNAANWIYQFSILSFIVTILTIPYNALIIARENMKIFAYFGVIEVLLKLGTVYLLILLEYDKLKLYAVLIFASACIVSLMYRIYSIKKYEESKFKIYWNKRLFRVLVNFSGWNLFGGVAAVLNNQGINILLNVFFGPVVNAARGISYQVSSAVNQFVLSFTTAVNPQITKFYAIGKKQEMLDLVYNSSKFSFFLLLVISTPVLLETNFLLSLWLVDVPDYVVFFTKLVIINSLIDSLSFSLQTAAQATGNIKMYQMVVGGMLLINVPVSYAFLLNGFPPQITFYISILISFLCLFLRLIMLKKLVGLSIQNYLNKVFLIIILVALLTYIIPTIILNTIEPGFVRFCFITLSTVLVLILLVFFIGITSKERLFFKNVLSKRLN